MKEWLNLISAATAESLQLVEVNGLAISNAAGVPGTGGKVAMLRRTSEPVLLTSYHVLFARGGKAGDPVHSFDRSSGGAPRVVGQALGGKAGIVLGLEPPTFVDAATIRLSSEVVKELGAPAPLSAARPQVGEAVVKLGAATGCTQGVIVDLAYPDHWYWEYRSLSAPNQLLIRSTDGEPFSQSGDSGAMIRNMDGHAVGLLWGTTARGEGVASPIHAVARALGLAIVDAQKDAS